MTVEKFLPLYLAAVDAGMTREDFAKKLGVATDTVYQRVYELNTKDGQDLPQLRLASRLTRAEQIKAAMESYKASKKGTTKETPAKAAPVVVKEVTPEPSEEDALAKLLNG